MQVQPRALLDAPLLNVMNFLNEVTLWYPHAISFAPGRPAEQFFDVAPSLESLARYADYVATQTNQPADTVWNQLGQYQRTNGIVNALIGQFLATDEHIHVPPEAIMITDGCQEAMNVVLAGLFEPGRDVLLVSDPTYIGITGIAAILGVEVCPVANRETGLDLADLTARIAGLRASGKNPKGLYVIPDFNNPLGSSMALDDRRRLLDLARDEQLLLIEDNAYGMFAYDGPPAPTLKSLDRDGQVIYLGTFSKILYPGLRLGFLVADQPCGDAPLAVALSKVKSMTTVSTSALLQGIVAGALLANDGSLRDVIAGKRAFYRTNRDAMLACLERAFAPDPRVSWNRPGGGFFLTVTLPFAFGEPELRACAADYGVICCPMAYFSLLPGRDQQVRLSFSYVTPEQIERGIGQLAQFVRDTLNR